MTHKFLSPLFSYAKDHVQFEVDLMLKNYLSLFTKIATTCNWLISEYCTLKTPTKFTFILKILRYEFIIKKKINLILISFFPLPPLKPISKSIYILAKLKIYS